ncbi:MAG: trypsin-like peptidase domain-containing protein, partial [bacterium]|nr:trypsin-like peptidase domain-containing protein [bacterium]
MATASLLRSIGLLIAVVTLILTLNATPPLLSLLSDAIPGTPAMVANRIGLQDEAQVDTTVADKAAPAVVLINAYSDVPVYRFRSRGDLSRPAARPEQVGTVRRRVSMGSGFFITPDGYLLTNRHVVSRATSEYRVSVTGRTEVPARVVYRDARYDLAILKVDGEGYPVVKLGDASRLEVGERVVAIGNAFGRWIDSVSGGTVSAVNQRIVVGERGRAAERLEGLIQTSAPLYPGDSGGPLLNSAGEVVGVNVATALGASVSYAIPANTARAV